MLLCHGPQSLCYDQTRRTPPHMGSRPIKWSSGKGRVAGFIHFTLLRIRPKIIYPLPGTGSRTKQPLSILRTGSGKGHNKKVVMHSLAGFNFWRACLHENNIQWKCALSFSNFLSRSFYGWVLFLSIVMPFKFSFPITDLFLEGSRCLIAWIKVGS
jgi:hypothetical protein